VCEAHPAFSCDLRGLRGLRGGSFSLLLVGFASLRRCAGLASGGFGFGVDGLASFRGPFVGEVEIDPLQPAGIGGAVEGDPQTGPAPHDDSQPSAPEPSGVESLYQYHCRSCR